MSGLDHIILFTFLIALFYFWGILFYKEKSEFNYIIFSLLPILSFAFIVGSRYGWGADYLFYKYKLDHIAHFKEEQIVFRYINEIILDIGFSYVGAFIVYSLILIISIFKLTKDYGIVSKYMYAFIIPTTLLFPTGIIRQGVALSFVFLALSFFNQKKWFFMLLSIIIGYFIHSSVLVIVLIMAAIIFFFKEPFSWKITIPLYLFFTFFFDVSNIGFLSKYIQLLSLNNQFQSYVDSSDTWFSSDAVNNIYEQGIAASIISSLYYVSIIYLGYITLKLRPIKKVIYVYNIVVFGVILLRAVFLYEILRRFADPLIMLSFIVLGYIFYVYFSNLSISTVKRKLLYSHSSASFYYWCYPVGIAFILVYQLLFWGRFVLYSPNYLFFWNK